MESCSEPNDASLLPVLLSRIGLAISVPILPVSDAVHCNRSRSALQPSPQCTASVLAVHCLFSPQTFATAIVNVCGEKMVKRHLLWNPFPHVFLLSPKKTDPAAEINRQLGQVFSCPSIVIGRKQYYMRFLFSITSSLRQKDAEPSYPWVLSTLLGYCRQSTLCEVEHGVAINTRSHPIWS